MLAKIKFSQVKDNIKVNALEAKLIRKLLRSLRFKRPKREVGVTQDPKTSEEVLKSEFKAFMRETLENFELIDSLEAKKLIMPFQSITESLWMNVIADNLRFLIFEDLKSVETFDSDPNKQNIYFPKKECKNK